jgi:BASS family bile acid:Na+ symporter
VDSGQLRELVRRPGRLILATAWMMLAPAALVTLALTLVGREALDPGLVLGLAVLGAAPPIMSAPAVAILLGLRPALVMAAVLLTTTLSAVVSPLLAELIAGAVVPLDLGVLIRQLLLLVGGAIVAAGIFRWWLGEARIRARRAELDGVGVLMYFLFAVAAMDGVLAAAMSDPARVARFLAVAFAISITGFLAAALLLRPLSGADRFVLGYGTGHRNMGLLIAALGAATPDTTFLFFALAQFPIYLMPQILKPLARRLHPVAAQ